jgi:hypothetical protein
VTARATRAARLAKMEAFIDGRSVTQPMSLDLQCDTLASDP